MMIRIAPCRAEDLDHARHAGLREAQLHHLRERWAMQERGEATLLLAHEGTRIVGRASVLRASMYAEVRAVYPRLAEVNALEASPRGRGVGTALLAAAEDDARRCGHRQLGLAVEPRNLGARRLYDRLGFVAAEGLQVIDHWQEFRPRGDGPWHHDLCDYLLKPL